MTQVQSVPQASRFLKGMLVTSCLTAVGTSAAMATTVTEGQNGTPTFPSSFPGYALPRGTTTVFGNLGASQEGSNNSAWFEFQGLTGTFDIHAFFSPLGQEVGMRFAVFNSADAQLGAGTLEGSGRFSTGTAPTDGNVIVEVYGSFGGHPGTFEVDSLSGNPTATTPVPEPATLALLAAPMAAALTWRRRRRG